MRLKVSEAGTKLLASSIWDKTYNTTPARACSQRNFPPPTASPHHTCTHALQPSPACTRNRNTTSNHSTHSLPTASHNISQLPDSLSAMLQALPRVYQCVVQRFLTRFPVQKTEHEKGLGALGCTEVEGRYGNVVMGYFQVSIRAVARLSGS